MVLDIPCVNKNFKIGGPLGSWRGCNLILIHKSQFYCALYCRTHGNASNSKKFFKNFQYWDMFLWKYSPLPPFFWLAEGCLIGFFPQNIWFGSKKMSSTQQLTSKVIWYKVLIIYKKFSLFYGKLKISCVAHQIATKITSPKHLGMHCCHYNKS